MKAIILAAGHGTRIKPLSDYTPKCLLPVLGRPLIDNILLYLKQYGVNEIAINTHHLAQKMTEYFQGGSKYGMQVFLSHEPRILGTGGGLGNLRDFILSKGDPNRVAPTYFIVHNGDTLTNLDLSPALEFHKEKNATVTLVLQDHPPLNSISFSSDGRVLDIAQARTPTLVGAGQSSKHEARNTKEYAFTGISIMHPRIFDLLPQEEFANLTDIFRRLILKGELYGTISKSHFWQEIGTVSDYLQVHRVLLVEKVSVLQKRDLQKDALFVGEGSRISEKSYLKGFISIGKDCTIREGVTLENCVVWDGVSLTGAERFTDSVVGKEITVTILPGGSDRKFYRIREILRAAAPIKDELKRALDVRINAAARKTL